MPAAFFINTDSADFKLVNRLLLHIRDWEFGEDPSWDVFYLINSEVLPDTDDETSTAPPIAEDALENNYWKNKSISDIESFVITERNKRKNIETALNLNTFMILDDQGVKDGTIILLDSPFNSDTNTMGEMFKKMRVPWEAAYTIWCNRDIANMDFEEYVEEEIDDEWSTYNKDPAASEETLLEVREVRKKYIANLVEEGHA